MDLEKCKKCKEKAVISIDADETPLCAYHYIEQEDEGCLKAYLKDDVDNYGKIKLSKGIQIEIKKQMPNLYEMLKEFFEV